MEFSEEERNQYKFIVFCEDHYNPLGLVRSLGEKKIKPIVLLVTNGTIPVLLNHSRYAKNIKYVDTISSGFELLLNEFAEKGQKHFVYTCDDKVTSFLDSKYNEIKDYFYFFNCCEEGRVSYYMDKENINCLAEKCGCIVPNREVVIKGESPSKVCYPVITKSIMSILGGWKDDVFICNNQEELFTAYNKIKAPKLLLEEYINKKNEFCVDGFSIKGGEEVFMPYYTNYLRFYNKSYGHYMQIYPFDESSVLYRQIKDILMAAKFSGIFSVEFIIDSEDQPKFLEVNFRNSTWSYAYTYAGANLPYYWALSTIHNKIEVKKESITQKTFRAMVEPDDLLLNVLSTKKIGFVCWIKDFFKTDVYYFYNKKDPGPCFFFWRKIIKSIFRQKINRLLCKKCSS